MVRLLGHYVSAKLTLLIVLEALVLVLSVWIGLWFHLNASGLALTDPATEVSLASAYGLCMLMIMSSMGLYEQSQSDEMSSVRRVRVLTAVLLGVGIALLAMQLVSTRYLGMDGLAVAVVGAVTGSSLLRLWFHKWADRGFFASRVLALGTPSETEKLEELAKHADYTVVCSLEPQPSLVADRNPLQVPPAGKRDLVSLVEKYAIDQIVVAVKDRRRRLPVEELLQCRLKGVRITELSTFFERMHRKVLLTSLSPSWMVFGGGFRHGVFRTVAKRLFDLTASGTLLLLMLPVTLAAALCIFLESGRPVLYRQERIGYRGRVFTMYKLRSMKNGAESDGTPRWAGANDDRTTRVGRILRKLRIDELPQAFNVLKGDMSFVGPRPERPYFVETLTKAVPYYALRHSVKPGITGWAQVRYPYGASVQDAIEKLQYDLYYVKNHTLFLDFVILLATVEVVLWGGGSGARTVQREIAPQSSTRLRRTSLGSR